MQFYSKPVNICYISNGAGKFQEGEYIISFFDSPDTEGLQCQLSVWYLGTEDETLLFQVSEKSGKIVELPLL